MALRVNLGIYSWTSCVFKIDNQPTGPDGTSWGLQSLDVSEKRERKKVRANRQDGRPIGRTSGRYEVDSVTMKFLKTGFEALTTYLAAQAQGSYGDVSFGLMIQIAEPIPGAKPLLISLKDCTIDGVKDGHEEGIDELLDEVEVGCLSLTRNGKSLYSVIRGLQQGSP
jgi:hypothetical protein